MATTASSGHALYLDSEGLERPFLKISPKYLMSKPLTLRKALAECLLAKGERGQAYVFKQYYGYLMAIAIRYVKDEMEAEDIVNEAFVKIFKNMREFSIEEDEELVIKTFKAWISRITVNTSIDKLRSRKSFTSLEEVSGSELVMHAVPISSKLEEQDILKLLYQLPDLQRSIFNLYEVEGYSHAEISSMLSIPESTSRTYLTRAKARLRALYTVHFDEIKL